MRTSPDATVQYLDVNSTRNSVRLLYRIAGYPEELSDDWVHAPRWDELEAAFWGALGLDGALAVPRGPRGVTKGGVTVRVGDDAAAAWLVLGSLLSPDPPEELLAWTTTLLGHGAVEVVEDRR